ncbi:MAG: hypothetical protein JRH11_16210 [Deltaproteobacteria bacterium]|nr:hypothetical protein [Deltaproteobacteria bacterium]
MTAVDGSQVEQWGDGDCDGDGVANGQEFFTVGCDPCDYDDLPALDGDGCMRQPVVDAGTDGGADSGPGSDAAADSGSAGDAARDATPVVDSSDDGGTFRGTGGCTCRAAGSTPMHGGTLPVGLSFAVLMGVAFRFRSSRRGGRGF